MNNEDPTGAPLATIASQPHALRPWPAAGDDGEAEFHAVGPSLWPRLEPYWSSRDGLRAFHELGRTVRQFHQAPLGSRSGRAGDADLAHLLTTGVAAGDWLDDIGADLRRQLAGWLTGLIDQGRHNHAQLSLASISGDGERLTLWVPRRAETASPALDLGRMLGDLTELAYRLQVDGQDSSAVARLGTVFLAGYRPESDRRLQQSLDQATVLRVVQLVSENRLSHGAEDLGAEYAPLVTWLWQRARDGA